MLDIKKVRHITRIRDFLRILDIPKVRVVGKMGWMDEMECLKAADLGDPTAIMQKVQGCLKDSRKCMKECRDLLRIADALTVKDDIGDTVELSYTMCEKIRHRINGWKDMKKEILQHMSGAKEEDEEEEEGDDADAHGAEEDVKQKDGEKEGAAPSTQTD